MIIIYIILGLIVLYIISIYALYRIVFYRSNKRSDLIEIKYTSEQTKNKNEVKKLVDKYYKKDNEEITIKSYDGLKLRGIYYHQDDKKPIIICFHGYKSDLYENYYGIKKIAFENNFNLLMVSQRAHLNSEGKTITFGIKERKDVLEWTKYISKRFPKNKIILAGTSMGASTIIMASDLNLPSNVISIIADSPYSSVEDILKTMLKQRKLPVTIMMTLIYNGMLLYGNCNLKYSSPIKSLKKNKLPILIIHGKNDNIIPSTMSEELYNKSRGKVQLHLFENSDHCVNYFEDPNKYEEIVINYIKKVK